MTADDTHRPAPRTPRQERARQKVELILEAAIRLLDKGGLAMLTTNAIAETAGVSIGTLYQYFSDKEAILDALADREIAALSDRILAVIEDLAAIPAEDRIARIVRAVLSSYGARRRVHRLLIGYSLANGGRRLAPLIERIIALLATPHAARAAPPMATADAFVLTNAFAGVMRATIMRADDDAPPQASIEAALVRLIAGFVESPAA